MRMEEAYFIRCHGVNLNNGFAEAPNKFTILTDDTHDVKELRIGFEGPSEPDVRLVTKKNNSCDVVYYPLIGGDYKIHIKYKGQYIFGSPFKCKIIGDVIKQIKKIKCEGATKEAKLKETNIINIDGRISAVEARLIGPSAGILKLLREEDESITLSYVVTRRGEYKLHVKSMNYNLQGSPFTIVCT